jgi:hypothetical protein
VRLSCHGRHAEVADFDPKTGALARRERTSEDDGEPIRGLYADLDGETAVFYRGDDGQLRLRVGDVVCPFGADPGGFTWSSDRGRSAIAIQNAKGERIDVQYDVPDWPPPSLDLTPFIEREHFDFGLFVRNVLADPARAQRLYGPRTN